MLGRYLLQEAVQNLRRTGIHKNPLKPLLFCRNRQNVSNTQCPAANLDQTLLQSLHWHIGSELEALESTLSELHQREAVEAIVVLF